jgi:PAS domain S-box-containing protein
MTVPADLQPELPDTAIPMAVQFRAIAEMGGDIAWSIDCVTGQPLYISGVIETMLGYPLAEVERQMGGGAGPLALMCAGLAPRLQRFKEGDASRLKLVREFDVSCSDGSTVPLEITSSFLLNAAGVPKVLVGIVRDLSDRRARDKERRRFASMLNHEFRTPLSTIDGAIQRLEATHHHADEATRARYRKIGLAVDRLIAMLDDYLSPERMIEIGQQRGADALSPRLVLEECAAMAREAGRHVTVDIGDLPASVRCDPAGLRLAMKILIDNAIQYSPGETTILLGGTTVAGAPGASIDKFIELSVTNAGKGIAASEADMVFKKFFRGRNAQGLPGSGLGLYMARSVIEVHGGAVELASAPGQSPTVFTLTLPVRDSGKSFASPRLSGDNPAATVG